MIYRGERNREEKIKSIAEYKELKKWEIENAKRCAILFLCKECGLQISFEDRQDDLNSAYMRFDFDNYKDFFQDEPDYTPFKNDYTYFKTRYWGAPVNHMCLSCGCYIEDLAKNICEECGSRNIVAGNELSGKPCPICGTTFDEGIIIYGLNNFNDKTHELKNEWWDIYRERYNVKKIEPANYTKEEIEEQERVRL